MLGFETTNKEFYKKALQHKSCNAHNNNERLEFLGDAILNAIVSEELFYKNKNKDEGFLSQKRAIIVSRKHLNKIGKKIIEPTKIKSELKKVPEKIFGNTLEAIIGAIYIDKGIEKTKNFILLNIMESEFVKELIESDYKSELQILAQKNKQKIEYKVLEKKGPDHKKVFVVGVFIDNIKISKAKASSIKEAEQKAAKETLNIVL